MHPRGIIFKELSAVVRWPCPRPAPGGSLLICDRLCADHTEDSLSFMLVKLVVFVLEPGPWFLGPLRDCQLTRLQTNTNGRSVLSIVTFASNKQSRTDPLVEEPGL